MHRLLTSARDLSEQPPSPRRGLPRWRIAVAAAGLLAASGAVASGAFALATATTTTTGRALINGDTVSGGANSTEAKDAAAAGLTVDVVTGSAWGTMTADQFGQYTVLIAGDPNCGKIAASLTANEAVWAPVVMGKAGGRTVEGNRVAVGTDPVLHAPGHPGGYRLVQDGINFASARAGATGMYFDTSCGGVIGQPGLAATMLQQLSSGSGAWSENDRAPCGGHVAKIASTPMFDSLKSSDIEGWSCSVHETFPTFASDWHPLAIATDAASRPVCGTDTETGAAACGEPYVLIAGSDIQVTAPNLQLTPPSGNDNAGGSHTVTATLARASSPIVGKAVSFNVSGVNSGVTGTCSANTDCTTDSSGQVSFTYADSHGAGDDTITASFVDVGSTQSATATEHWKVPPRTAPDTPTAVMAAAGNASASVSFTPPGSDGGSAITGYTVTATDTTTPDNGGQTAPGDSSPITVPGLTNGDSYTFTVHARNAVGDGPESDPSNAVTPQTTTDTPTAVIATAGNASASVSFTPPASDGGNAIIDYTVTATDTTTPDNGGQTAPGGASPITVSGLTNGDSYTFTVHASNAAGDGPESEPSNAVTPQGTPDTPTAVIATAGKASASVSFTPPAFDGGSAITSYTVTATDTTTPANGGQTASGDSSPITVAGLTNGDSYTFTVHASNAVGDGPESEPSSAVTPQAEPAPYSPPVPESASPSPSPSASSTRQALTLTVLDPSIPAGQSARLVATGAPGQDYELRCYTRPSRMYLTSRAGAFDAAGDQETFTLWLGRNTRCFIQYTTNPSEDASKSVVVNVNTVLSLSTVRTGTRTFVFQGRNLPRAAGQLITLYRLDSMGNEIRTSNLITDDTGTYRVARTFTGTGTFRFIVRTPQTLNNAAGASATITVNVL